MDLSTFTNEQIHNIIRSLLDELDRRQGAPVEDEDPAQAFFQALSERGGSAPRKPGTSLMPNRAPAPAARMSNAPTQNIVPGTVLATARTDPEAARVFAATKAREDGMPPVKGNGVGMGGEVEPVI